MRKILFALAALVTMVSCADKGPKVLVLYYSQTGTTEAVAQEIGKQLGADVEKFDVTEPYDGTYQQTIMRGQKEMASGILPEIVPVKADLRKYDVVFLGFPIWYGQPCLPLQALISTVDLSGKKVVPFCTFGSGGLVESTAFLREALPESEIAEGYGVRSARIDAMPAEVARFLAVNGYIASEEAVAEYGEFSAQAECTEEEASIFHAATSGYAMPLGMPASVGSRAVDGGTEYKFKTLDGNDILVLALEGQEPVFTRVDR